MSILYLLQNDLTTRLNIAKWLEIMDMIMWSINLGSLGKFKNKKGEVTPICHIKNLMTYLSTVTQFKIKYVAGKGGDYAYMRICNMTMWHEDINHGTLGKFKRGKFTNKYASGKRGRLCPRISLWY